MAAPTRTGLRLTDEEIRERRPNPEQVAALVARFRTAIANASSEEEARRLISQIARITRQYRIRYGIGLPTDPAAQALELDRGYVLRPHISLLSERIAQAVQDVEHGVSRYLAISMPPRSGKSTLTSLYSPLWMLRRHPEWPVVMTSYDPGLTVGWARQIRRFIESNPSLGIALAPDGGAGGQWVTEEDGGMYSVGIGGALTGRGARVLVVDDPVSDFGAAHSPRIRQNLWDWWLSVAQTRLEPPHLVLVVMTRWHEDDFVGRLFSHEYEGDPLDWEQVVLPAIADQPDDPLGREVGEPLYSPLLHETREEALARWDSIKSQVGTYVFEAMYQQHPSPAKGAIFDVGWWRYWTTDPGRATEDGRIRFLDPNDLAHGNWLDSWDAAFKGGDSGSWVVGQRWVQDQANRYLVGQRRGRWSFTQTIQEMEAWCDPYSPYGAHVHRRLIEDKANGPAIIDTLREKIPGLTPVNPNTSKEARARAVTPEVESGNVYLPHPSDPGNEWVMDLLSELRNFPHDLYDDQVDALTQALMYLRSPGRGQVTVPGNVRVLPTRNLAAAARSDMGRQRGWR